MSMAMKGLTHCTNCGTSLDMGEFGYCSSCRAEMEKEEEEKRRLQEKENLKAEIIGVVRDDLSKNLTQELIKVQNEFQVLDLDIERPKGSRYDEWFADIGYKVLQSYIDGNKSIIVNFIEGDDKNDI